MLNLLYTSNKPVTPQYNFIYIPNADAFYLVDNGKEINRVYRDGTSLRFGDHFFFSSVYSFNIDTQDGVVIGFTGDNSTWFIDRLTWAADLTRNIVSNLGILNLRRGVFITDYSGSLKYYRPNITGYERYDVVTGVLEVTINNILTGSTDSIHFMKNQQVCLFDYSTGQTVFYDVFTQSVILDTVIEPCAAVAFDTTYQNVTSIRLSDNRVQTYESKPRIAKLSALTFVPGNFKRYVKESISVIVQGSVNEPIPDVDIQWDVFKVLNASNSINSTEINSVEILTGSSFLPSKGQLTPKFGVTDQNGVATANYCPPGLDWILNDTEVIIPKVKQ